MSRRPCPICACWTASPVTIRSPCRRWASFFGDLAFDVYQGNGGHVPGETVLVDDRHRIAVTGDDYINAVDMLPAQKEFNRLAPYLARSVNQDSVKYRAILQTLRYMLADDWLLLPGHGAIVPRDQRL